MAIARGRTGYMLPPLGNSGSTAPCPGLESTFLNKHIFFPNFQYFYDPKNSKIPHSVMLLEHLENCILKFSPFAPLPSAPTFSKSWPRPWFLKIYNISYNIYKVTIIVYHHSCHGNAFEIILIQE